MTALPPPTGPEHEAAREALAIKALRSLSAALVREHCRTRRAVGGGPRCNESGATTIPGRVPHRPVSSFR